MRRESKQIAYGCMGITLIAIPVVVLGWVAYDFFGPEFTDPDSKIPDFERYYFGIISGVAFVVIVVPWLCAVMSIFGLLNILVVALSTRVLLFRYEVERVHRETLTQLDEEMSTVEGGDQIKMLMDRSKKRDRTPSKYQNYFSYANMALYPRLAHEAFLIRRQIHLACHEFENVLGMLALVTLFY